MKYLKIQNDGELDIRLVALMGGTTKANDQYKIGQFGTGLKYTLAYLFRNNIDFKIFVGNKEVELSIETEVIKDENFDIICINGNRTSITTRMGADWEAWMIIRELWCNALDEGGEIRDIVTEPIGIEGKTIFYLQIDKDFQDVLNNWGDYFIHGNEPLYDGPNHRIYHGGKKVRIYKQGVLIHTIDQPGLFSYDVKNASINELREFKGVTSAEIVRALKNTTPNVITHFLENVTESHFEGTMDYKWYESFGQVWRDTIGNAKLIHQKAVDTIKERGAEFDAAKTIILPIEVYNFLTAEFKGIGALRTADKINEFYEIHSEALSERMNEVFAILEVCEYSVHPELKFIFGAFGDKNILGQVNLDTKEVMLSDSLLEKSLFNFIAVIIEENEHFKSGFSDCTRNFQQHFINLFTKTLLDKNAVKL
jgi:hypothetical protein